MEKKATTRVWSQQWQARCMQPGWSVHPLETAGVRRSCWRQGSCMARCVQSAATARRGIAPVRLGHAAENEPGGKEGDTGVRAHQQWVRVLIIPLIHKAARAPRVAGRADGWLDVFNVAAAFW